MHAIVEELVKLIEDNHWQDDFEEAVRCFRKSVELRPDILLARMDLVQALEVQGQLDKAIEVAQDTYRYLSDNGREHEAAKVQEYLKFLELKKSKQGGM